MVDWNLANTDASQWVKQNRFDLAYAGVEITPQQEQQLKQELINFIEGELTVNQLAKRIEPLFGPEAAKTIAVTEVTRAYAEGNIRAWRLGGFIEGKEWRTAVDELVCSICGPLHGQIVQLNSQFEGGYDGPPAHPQCRCWLVPVPELETEEQVLLPGIEDHTRPRWWQFWR